MSLRDLIIKEYQAVITNSPSLPSELKKALAVNERYPAFLDNITRELSVPAFKNYSRNEMRKTVRGFIEMFISLVQQKATEQMMSDIKKMEIKQQIADKEVINRAADTGIIDEEVLDVISRQKEKETT